jgi:Uncharacterized protein conserved in bacteria
LNVQIVIDSTSDITPQMAKAMGNVHIMPLTVSFGNEHFQDGIDITPETFYTRLVHDSNVPTTTQPLPGYVMELVSRLSKETGPDTYSDSVPETQRHLSVCTLH